MKTHLIKYKADVFSQACAVPIDAFSKKSYFSTVSCDCIQDKLYSSCLSSSILPDKSTHTTFRYLKTYIVQFKISIVLRYIFKFNYILHFFHHIAPALSFLYYFSIAIYCVSVDFSSYKSRIIS